jgi:uncharacterized 2Fe-2S/4Fe-4S cluster protein (DUF4445 family)
MTEDIQGWVRTISLPEPALQNNTADADRLVSALKSRFNAPHVAVDLCLVRQLPDLLRKWKYRVRCTVFRDRHSWVLAGVTDPEDTAPVTGLAIDLGTSRVVIRLLDLLSGRILGESSFDNPQIHIGPDVLTRIHYAEQAGGLPELTRLIVHGINTNLAALCKTADTDPEDIHIIAAAGNTVMTHLFLGLTPYWLVREPYIPAINSPGLVKAEQLGLKTNPFARVLVFPNVGSYFGGDLIAGILYSGLHKNEDTALLVDVGTNAEVVLGNKNWIMGCAGAAGPALEGGVTKMGMMAGPGVIDKIRIDYATGRLETHTIGEQPPVGICGSGLIDLAAQLFVSGVIDIRGKLNAAEAGSRLKEKDGIAVFVVVPAEASATGADLSISQADLDSLVRSKAAMYTILETLTETVGISLRELSAFYVAGTFGSFIDPESAIAIGMMPDLPHDRYIPLGNSSLEGATLALTTNRCLNEIFEIRDQITYLELNVNQDFMNRFSAAKFFPHTDLTLFPSVKVRR